MNWVHVRYDYKEYVRLPVCPAEPGSWFYPEFQNEVTVLGGLVVYSAVIINSCLQ